MAASSRGDPTGPRAVAFAKDGTLPTTDKNVLIMLQCTSLTHSPFSPFSFPSEADIQHCFGDGRTAPKHIEEVLDKIEELSEHYMVLEGMWGCWKDRICGLPPVCCLLPGICCLGGACAVAAQNSHNVKQMTAAIKKIIWEANSAREVSNEAGRWQLCAAAHRPSGITRAWLELNVLGDWITSLTGRDTSKD